MYRTPLEVPARYQWDPDSQLPLPTPGTAPGNCGVTCATVMAQYVTDNKYGIYATRRLAVSNDSQMFTTISDQQLMLAKRGVAATAGRPTIETITNLVAAGKPVLVGLQMSLVPPDVAGHSFRGSHAVLLRANSVRNGVAGKLVLDPNFNRTYRRDPTDGRRFYSDALIKKAYYDTGTMWALTLDKPKLIPSWYGRVRIDGPGHTIRTSAQQTKSSEWAYSRQNGTYRGGQKLWDNSYQYYWDGERVLHNGVRYFRVKTHTGQIRFIRTGAAVVTRKA
jgi:hypothetical protein